MKALLLLLLATGANALSIKAPSPNSTSISPSTITATGTGYSIQATNGNVYAKYGVSAATVNVRNGGDTTLTNITQNTDNGAVLVSGTNTDLAYRPLVMGSFTNSNPTKPVVGMWWQNDNNAGTNLFLGTSNSFATGITNSAFAINHSGNVGLGTPNPATKLHMSSGTLTVDGTGSPAAGGALCLNAAKALSKCTSAVDASGNCTCP